VAEEQQGILAWIIEHSGGLFDRVLPRRAAAIARKESHHIVRDPYTLGMSVGVPVMMLILFGYAISFDVKDLKVSIQDLDRTPASRAIVEGLRGSGFFLPQPSTEDPEAEIASEKVRVALIIPAGFQRAIGRQESPDLQLLVDGSDNGTAGVAQAYVVGAVTAAYQRLVLPPGEGPPRQPIQLKPRFLFNGELNSTWFIVPGLLGIIVGLLSVLMTALTVAREWENGSMEQLLTTPAKPIEIILGKVAPYIGLGLLTMIIVYIFARGAFGVPFRGSHIVFGLGCLLFLFVALSQGLLISVAARNQMVAFQMSMMMGMLPLMLLSGFIYPIQSMPLFFRIFTGFLPPRWFMVIMRGVFLKGATFAEMWLPFLLLALMSLGLTALAVKRFKTDLEP
jgi:ABC-2 type transport system permease protein